MVDRIERRFAGYAHADGEVDVVFHTPITCPKCGSHNVNGQGKITEIGIKWSDLNCQSCGYFWDPQIKSLPSSAQEIAQQQGAGRSRVAELNSEQKKALEELKRDNPQIYGKDSRAETETGAPAWMKGHKTNMAASLGMPVIKDHSKARWDLLPYGPLWAVAEVFMTGALKPGRTPHNWRNGTEWSKYFAPAMRHLAAYQQGEDYDVEVINGVEIRQPHLACAICCLLILLEYQQCGIGTDDRFPAGRPAYKGTLRANLGNINDPTTKGQG